MDTEIPTSSLNAYDAPTGVTYIGFYKPDNFLELCQAVTLPTSDLLGSDSYAAKAIFEYNRRKKETKILFNDKGTVTHFLKRLTLEDISKPESEEFVSSE